MPVIFTDDPVDLFKIKKESTVEITVRLLDSQAKSEE